MFGNGNFANQRLLAKVREALPDYVCGNKWGGSAMFDTLFQEVKSEDGRFLVRLPDGP
jgi:hypothetical protein